MILSFLIELQVRETRVSLYTPKKFSLRKMCLKKLLEYQLPFLVHSTREISPHFSKMHFTEREETFLGSVNLVVPHEERNGLLFA